MPDQITPILLASEYATYKNKPSLNADTRTQWEADIYDCAAAVQGEGFCNRRFDERIETRLYTPLQRRNGGHLQGVSLLLDDDLMTLTTLLNGNGVDVTAAAVLEPLNSSPAHTLWLNPDQAQWSAPANNTPTKGSISVTGTWGYRGRWAALGELNADVSDTNTTTFTVLDGTLYESGMLLKVGSEYVLVDDVTGNDLTVVRGHNGSTAATHLNGATIERHHFEPRIVRAMKRFLDWVLAQKSSPFIGKAQIGDFEIPIDMTELPKDIQRLFAAMQRSSARLRTVGD